MAASEGTGPTALLVEDDEHSIDLLSLYVAEAGFDVAIARNGEEGLELGSRLHPCGIILDIRLPGLDGWEFLARAKADPVIADVPVIIVSMVDERGKGLALGAADYLVKPVARGAARGARSGYAVAGIREGACDRRRSDSARADQGGSRACGLAVLTARGGEEGVALVQAELPDVVLLDLAMPEVDGFAVSSV